MFPEDKQSAIEKDLIGCFVPKDSSAVAVAVVAEIMDLVVERRKKLFPDLRKVIVDFETTVVSDGIKLNVTSAPIADHCDGGTARH